MKRHLSRRAALPAGLLLLALTASACSPSNQTATSGSEGGVTVQNCGQDASYPQPVERMFVNDGGMIAIALAAGAREKIAAVSALARDEAVLRLKYGSLLDGLKEVNPKSPTLENVIAARPQLVYAGWNYGFSESKGLTPEALAQRDIRTYQLSEACRQIAGEKARGTMDPWLALDTDLRNIGAITGNREAGEKAAQQVSERLEALRALPKPAKKPTVFLVDGGTDTIFTSGSFGGPQGIIDAAGARSGSEDVADTWTTVSWERLITADPDLIAFVDYPGQTVDEKIAALKGHPGAKGLKAVRENRFINLPYAMWVSSPLNIDAAETLRAVLEKHDLAPRTGLVPALDVRPLGLGGNDWL